ncbi:MAG: DegT/DnrJ/EryC1/StrS family aminotransferase [Nitrospirae bacterium]|nr:DegT/DnrJ/EryC1/StrS family aminotransferase [Nitrospirota bacterium]
MRELYRVLKKGGWGIVQSPVLLDLVDTFEDPSITTDEGRRRHFGQPDHVRVYAKADYIGRLSEAGFSVKCIGVDHLGEDVFKRAAITTKSVLYVVEKRQTVNVTRTYLPNLQRYHSYVESIFQGGWLTNYSRYVRELEERLAIYLGVKHVIVMANGTLALQVAYKALGLTGEVITTPFTFIATSSSLAWEGLTPVFVDIDQKTYNIDPGRIEEAITDNTSAIVAVHVFGNPCALEDIQQIALRHGLKVIYDAAHSFGVGYEGRSVLGWGDVSTLSFHATKIFHTAEGGAVVTNDDCFEARVRKMINFGITGPESIVTLGINAKMSELHAAIGLSMLDDMDNIICLRKSRYVKYINSLSDKIILQCHNPNVSYNYAYFPVVFETEALLLKVEKALKEKDIHPRRYFYPSLDTLYFLQNKEAALSIPHAPSLVGGGALAISNSVSRRILCLPIYESLDINDQERIIETVNGVVRAFYGL